MPTLAQLKQYLTSIGVPLPPDFILEAWLAQVAKVESCMVGAGYDAGTKLLIYMYLLGMFGIANGDKYVSSQTAPSGASQSFRYKADGTQFNNLRAMLRNLDKSGCTSELVPSLGKAAGFFVVSANGRCC